MSTNNRVFVVIVLAAAGSLGCPIKRAAAVQDERGAARPSASSTPRCPEKRYLLLSSGQLVHGIVTEKESEYLVQQRVGVMRFAKKQADGVFNSIREAFEYRLAALPKGDFDEGMKLAYWCLNLKMTSEARALLTDIVKHNPTNKRAKAMLVSIEQAAMRASMRRTDPEVLQTRADTRVEPRPAPLDAAILNRAQRELGISDLPVIFDLPTALAVKRSDEFFQFVHPVLQLYCAKCHDGQHNGAFQLVPIKKRADKTPDALRATLMQPSVWSTRSLPRTASCSQAPCDRMAAARGPSRFSLVRTTLRTRFSPGG